MDLDIVSQLSILLRNPSLSSQLASLVEQGQHAGQPQDGSGLFLRIEGSLCRTPSAEPDRSLSLGCIDLHTGRAVPQSSSTSTPDPNEPLGNTPLTPQSLTSYDTAPRPSKRRKTVSGLRLAPASTAGTSTEPDSNSDNPDSTTASYATTHKSSVRQVHSDTRFPQRKKPGQDGAPVLEPTSTDKLIAGIWRQVFSPVQLSRIPSVFEPSVDIRTGVSGEVFRAVNTLCLKYYNQSQSSRALEMIVQAYWIECYQARIAVIRHENPHRSSTEARMLALKEACATLNWKEKDLRNRIAIWRGYKDIKDAGGWASLIFASAGVYRFCKYRSGFDESFSARFRHVQSGLEVVADTLHPEWRDLLQVIGQASPRQYHGHPHEWVTVTGQPALPLASTYAHLQSVPTSVVNNGNGSGSGSGNGEGGFHYRFIDECIVDRAVFGSDDPRVVPGLDPSICPACNEVQSDEIETNQCGCFPTLFGGIRGHVPVQLFQTTSGKNNGVVARCNFDRGTAIGEFVGLVTNGIEGVDVMLGGSRSRSYQIYQGQMGNFTRFINHSCRPNSQFQRFYWRGVERIIVVSRGVVAGNEITVDYSDHYWRQLNKACMCGEPCCRFGGR